MRMESKVTYNDGRTVEAVAKPKDIVAFERQYGIPFVEAFSDKLKVRMEWLFYLAWSPLHRQGREPRAFDEFLDDVDTVDVEDEEVGAEPDPTQPEVSAEPLPG